MKQIPGIILVVLGVILLAIGILIKILHWEILGLGGNELLSIGSLSLMIGLVIWFIFKRTNNS